jgi:hypothetical protein
MPLSRVLETLSRWASGSNGASASARLRPSNATGPNMNGLAILALRAFSKLAGTFGSKTSSDLSPGSSLLAALSSSAASSSPVFFPAFFAFCFAFLAASICCYFFSSWLFLRALEASARTFCCSAYSEVARAYRAPMAETTSLPGSLKSFAWNTFL